MDIPQALVEEINNVLDHWEDHEKSFDEERKKFQYLADEISEQANATQRFTAEDFAFRMTA